MSGSVKIPDPIGKGFGRVISTEQVIKMVREQKFQELKQRTEVERQKHGHDTK